MPALTYSLFRIIKHIQEIYNEKNAPNCRSNNCRSSFRISYFCLIKKASRIVCANFCSITTSRDLVLPRSPQPKKNNWQNEAVPVLQ